MALSYDRNTQRRPADLTDYPAGVDVVYDGSLVTVDTTGYAVAGQAVAGYRFVGVADRQVDNASGTAGDKKVLVWKRGEFLFDYYGTATQADVGKRLFLRDDATVCVDRQTGNIIVGELRGIESSGTKVWVDIQPGTEETQRNYHVLRGSITAVTSATQAVALANPFGERVIVTDVVLDVTTKSTGAATVDCGVAANGTTSSDTLLDGLDVGTSAIIGNNIDNKGNNGGRGKAWASSEYITVTASATLAGLVGTYTIFCLLPTAR